MFTSENTDFIPSPHQYFSGPSLSSCEINKERVLQKLLKLDNSKSPGPDGIHPCVLKECALQIAEPLSFIFQKSIGSGILPIDWKLASITPIHKKGKCNTSANY